MSSEKKISWTIPVRRDVLLKVVFDEPVSAEEAIEMFQDGAEGDVLDEDIMSEEVIGGPE
jgi:hypothetical protein